MLPKKKSAWRTKGSYAFKSFLIGGIRVLMVLRVFYLKK